MGLLMYSAFDFKVNKAITGLNTLGTFKTPSGVATELLYIEQPEGVKFYLRDILKYGKVLECLDVQRVIDWIGRGLTWGRLEANPKRLLGALPRVKGVEVGDLAREALGVVKRLLLEYGPITPLLMWDDLEDLVVDEADPDGRPRIFIRARGFGDAYHQLVLFPDKCEVEEKRARNEDGLGFNEYLLNRASERTRTPVTAYNPTGMATDSEFRVRISMNAQPVSRHILAFRKHPGIYWHLGHLIAGGSISLEDSAGLLLASLGIRPFSTDGEPRPILVYGPMGSGKTTMTNAILNTYPPWVRVVAVQDVDEFRILPDRTFALLNTRASTGLGARPITKAQLIANALRTGAQYIFVNEILNPGDARAWIRAVTSGHGGVTNIHAGSLEELLDRLERLGIRNPERLIRDYIITVKMIGKRVVEVKPPSRASLDSQVPVQVLDGLKRLSENPSDYTIIRVLWSSVRCIVESGSIECLSN